jgi:hypothetical protein
MKSAFNITFGFLHVHTPLILNSFHLSFPHVSVQICCPAEEHEMESSLCLIPLKSYRFIEY